MAFTKLASLINSTPDGLTFTTGSMDTTGADLIVVLLSFLNSGACFLSDSQGNTYFHLQPAVQGLNTGLYFCVSPATSASHTFTATSTGTNYPTIAAIAFSGAAAIPFDKQNGDSSGSASSLASGSVTPSEDNELLVTGAGHAGGSFTGVSSPFMLEQSVGTAANNYAAGIGYEIQTTATARSATWTDAVTAQMQVVIASFKAAAIGGGVVVPVFEHHYRQLRQR